MKINNQLIDSSVRDKTQRKYHRTQWSSRFHPHPFFVSKHFERNPIPFRIWFFRMTSNTFPEDNPQREKICASRFAPDTQHVWLIECNQKRKRILGNENRFENEKKQQQDEVIAGREWKKITEVRDEKTGDRHYWINRISGANQREKESEKEINVSYLIRLKSK